MQAYYQQTHILPEPSIFYKVDRSIIKQNYLQRNFDRKRIESKHKLNSFLCLALGSMIKTNKTFSLFCIEFHFSINDQYAFSSYYLINWLKRIFRRMMENSPKNHLTLKQKIQLLKINKRPRKQVRVRFQTITSGLNLPAFDQSSIVNIRNFKENKIEHPKSYKKQKIRISNSRSMLCDSINILSCKNELFRQQLLKKNLINRKNIAVSLKSITEEYNEWIVGELPLI